MPRKKPITVAVECETPRDYRALRQLVAIAPKMATLRPDGYITVIDHAWFENVLRACAGRVYETIA